MGFQEVASLDAEVTIAIGKVNKETGKPYPKSAEGYFLGSRSVESKRGSSFIHFLQTPEGNLGVWGTTDLNRKLGQVTPGSMVRITSTGTKPTPNGDMYTYKVEADKNNTIDVGNLGRVEINADDDSDSSDDSDDNDNEAILAAAHVEQKARVEAILNKGKNAKKA